MSLSGFLYVAIVVGWAVYLVPFALRRYDEATRHRSIDRFSSAMRVLGRREGEEREEQDATRSAAPPTETPQRVLSPAARKAAQTAARRRRRVLLTLLFALAATATAAGLALVPWWSVAIPGGLVVLWLVLCRTQVRREAAARENVPVRVRRADPVLNPRNVGVRETADEPVAVRAALSLPEVEPDDEPTVVLQRADLEAAGVVGSSRSATARSQHPEGQGSLWDPVPVTLPTYVHKPRAPRTFRTIDLGAPDVQTSGRTEDPPSRTSGPAAPPAEQPAQPAEPTRRAVGE